MCFMPTLEDKGQDGAEPSHNLTQHGGSTRDCQVDTKEQGPHCSRKNNALNQTLVSTMEELKEGLMISHCGISLSMFHWQIEPVVYNRGFWRFLVDMLLDTIATNWMV